MDKKQPTMTREQAGQLYDALKKRMEGKYGRKGLSDLIEEERKKKKASPNVQQPDLDQLGPAIAAQMMAKAKRKKSTGKGHYVAILFVLLCAAIKIGLSIMEATGVVSVETASAALAPQQTSKNMSKRYSREEVRILKSLDVRRVALEERDEQLDQREDDLKLREREFAGRLTELRELSESLKLARERDDRKAKAQLDQLANVYGSMNPKEAAHLIEQLDISIALRLIERMPEKRIGQILSMMQPERALTITRMMTHQVK